MATSPDVSIAKFPSFWIVKIAAANGTPVKDIAAGPCTLYHVRTAHTAESTVGPVTYLKLYDAVNPTVGTTEAHEQIEVPVAYDSDTDPNALKVESIPINPPKGLKFENGLSAACVAEKALAGTTAPTSNVEVEMIIVPENL